MRTVIVYSSTLGTTRRYAMWLREALEADLAKASATRRRIEDYDLVIICSPTCMGQVKLNGYLKKRWAALKERNVILVVVGMMSQEHPDSVRAYQSIPGEIRSRIKYFKLPGKIGPINKDKVRQENLQPILEYIRATRGLW